LHYIIERFFQGFNLSLLTVVLFLDLKDIIVDSWTMVFIIITITTTGTLGHRFKAFQASFDFRLSFCNDVFQCLRIDVN
jgi:hypothetical protein